MQIRYDEEKKIYRDCKFCGGKGCLACSEEADKEYKRQFKNINVPDVLVDHTLIATK